MIVPAPSPAQGGTHALLSCWALPSVVSTHRYRKQSMHEAYLCPPHKARPHSVLHILGVTNNSAFLVKVQKFYLMSNVQPC